MRADRPGISLESIIRRGENLSWGSLPNPGWRALGAAGNAKSWIQGARNWAEGAGILAKDLTFPPKTTSRKERVGAEERESVAAAGVSSSPERGRIGEGKAELFFGRNLGGDFVLRARGARASEPN